MSRRVFISQLSQITQFPHLYHDTEAISFSVVSIKFIKNTCIRRTIWCTRFGDQPLSIVQSVRDTAGAVVDFFFYGLERCHFFFEKACQLGQCCCSLFLRRTKRARGER
ncbi:hypothetical protein A3218_01865 [Pseudomonas chlororaphis]|nr:hypothetical protein A3218_01865 [Pseudomonas chlororaphis]